MRLLIYLSPLFLIAPIFESISALLDRSPITDGEINSYLLCIGLALLWSLITIGTTSSTLEIENNFSNDFTFTPAELLIVTIAALIPFIYFIHTNLASYSLIDIVIFSEEYRNGIYKGSGIYTALLIQFLPAILAINIALGSNFNKGFSIALFALVIGTLILGLRIYLLKVFLSFLYRLTKRKTKSWRVLIGIIVILFMSSIYKFFLDINSNEEKSIYEHFFNPLTRLNLPALIKYQLGYGADQIYCLLPTMQYSDICNGESFKTNYFSNNPKISLGFPLLSKFSGVAIPLPVYFYNLFGIFAASINAIFLTIIAILYNYIEGDRPIILGKILALLLVISLGTALVEDMTALQFLDQSLIMGVGIFLMIKIRIHSR